jgi:Ca2+-binding RTX toxin-like protein
MQSFNADGTRSGTEQLVNTNTTGNQDVPSITQLSGGAIAVVWTDELPTGVVNGSGYVVKVRLYTGGVPGAEIVVSTTPTGNQSNADIVGLAGGRFVFVWTDYSGANGDPVSGLRARIFEANGTAVGSEFSVKMSTASRQDLPRVAALPDGGFVVTWDDLSLTQDTSQYGILGQIFDANDVRVGTAFLVNTTTNDFQRDSAVIALNDGFFVAWADTNGSVGETNLGPNIRGQRFLYSTGLAFVADPGDDNYTGGAGVDSVDYSNATGSVYADARYGAPSDGFDGVDVYASIESLTGSPFADILIGSDGANVLFGGPGADQLYGLGGDDELIGGAGPNTLQGGTGNDIYRVSDAGDSIVEFAGEGIDIVFASSAVFTLPGNVENLTAANTAAAFVGMGNAIDNIIRGGCLPIHWRAEVETTRFMAAQALRTSSSVALAMTFTSLKPLETALSNMPAKARTVCRPRWPPTRCRPMSRIWPSPDRPVLPASAMHSMM